MNEAYLRSPKVLTASEIQRKVGVSYKTALLLKRRVQLFATEQRDIFRNLIFQKLNQQFQDFQLPEAQDSSPKTYLEDSLKRKNKSFTPVTTPGKAMKKALKGKTQVNADTLVLFSASQRANKGRRRHKHGGSTASIYMSDKLGGKQIGTLVQTIATSDGALILDSIPDQKMNTLGPLFLKNLPHSTPVFTDSAYTWLGSVYGNHRMVNHSARSKDSRYQWARNRWSKDGVHIQYAEGNHRVIKQAFSEYGYIRPEYSQLYLNEFCFFKNLKAFGVEKLVSAVKKERGIEIGGSNDSSASSPSTTPVQDVKVGRKSVLQSPSLGSEAKEKVRKNVRIIQKK
ncbi:transposase, partial [Leptospira kmetyi]|uniref:transposase n=1 Tax=Leptospira kmetyi TaxID=408139 RepID=UPI001FED53DB